MERFTREEYFSCISVLFQDYTLLPVTLDENLTGSGKEEIDRSRLERDLTLSGFAERYEKTPGKGNASVIREVNGDSVDFSAEKSRSCFLPEHCIRKRLSSFWTSQPPRWIQSRKMSFICGTEKP